MLVKKKGGGRVEKTVLSSLSVSPSPPPLLIRPNSSTFLEFSVAVTRTKDLRSRRKRLELNLVSFTNCYNTLLCLLPAFMFYVHTPLTYIHTFFLFSGLKCNLKACPRVATLILAGHVFKYNKAGVRDPINLNSIQFNFIIHTL